MNASQKPWLPKSVARLLALPLLLFVCVAPTLTWAGEKTVVAMTTDASLPPNVSLVVQAIEPATLPAATELEGDLLYRLRRHPKLFSRVLASGPTGDPGVADFLIDVNLVQLAPIDTARRPLWLWLKRPIAERGAERSGDPDRPEVEAPSRTSAPCTPSKCRCARRSRSAKRRIPSECARAKRSPCNRPAARSPPAPRSRPASSWRTPSCIT